MNSATTILSTLLGLAIVLMIAPSVFAMNRGKMLRNIALWLAIVLAISLAYRTLGPGKLPMAEMATLSNPADDLDQDDKTPQQPEADDQNYTPPKE